MPDASGFKFVETKEQEDEVATVLRRAAQIIRDRGWTQGEVAQAYAGPVCAIGALMAAQGTEPYAWTVPRRQVFYTRAAKALAYYLRDTEPFGSWTHPEPSIKKIIPYWNDVICASAGQCAEAFDRAADARALSRAGRR